MSTPRGNSSLVGRVERNGRRKNLAKRHQAANDALANLRSICYYRRPNPTNELNVEFFVEPAGGPVQTNRHATLQLETDELRKTATWREQFCGRQQDKARFFITLLSTEMFVVGLSLNSKPEQHYLLVPCAVSFLICFASAFISMFQFAKVIEPRFFHGRDEGADANGDDGHELLLLSLKTQASLQCDSLQAIIDDQAVHLRKGMRSFTAFNCVFAAALVVSRLTWFLPH